MADPDKIKALLRVGKLLGRTELETLFKQAYEGCKTGKTLTGWGVNGKSGTLSILSGMTPADMFALADEALSLFDTLTVRGTLDAYIGSANNQSQFVNFGASCGATGYPNGCF